MKTKFNKIISMFLIFCMIFTLLPMNVFAVPPAQQVTQEGNNGETGDTGMDIVTGGDYLLQDTAQRFFGIRFSLYFAEGLKSAAEVTESTEFEHMGSFDARIINNTRP